MLIQWTIRRTLKLLQRQTQNDLMSNAVVYRDDITIGHLSARDFQTPVFPLKDEHIILTANQNFPYKSRF